MASTITTAGTSPDPITTARAPGESVAAWIGNHSAAVLTATLDKSGKLVTTWYSSGTPEETISYRARGETDEQFLERHVLAYTNAMVDNPPSEELVDVGDQRVRPGL